MLRERGKRDGSSSSSSMNKCLYLDCHTARTSLLSRGNTHYAYNQIYVYIFTRIRCYVVILDCNHCLLTEVKDVLRRVLTLSRAAFSNSSFAIASFCSKSVSCCACGKFKNKLAGINYNPISSNISVRRVREFYFGR